MKLNGSIITAMLIFAVVAFYMLTGDFIQGGKIDPNEKTIAQTNEDKSSKAFAVRTSVVSIGEQQRELAVRGRTKAKTIVPIRAETNGTLLARSVNKGDSVSAGDVLCELDTSTRASVLAQAKASLKQAEFDLQSNQKLLEKGFATKAQINRLEAARDGAQASLDAAQKDLDRTQITATVSGIVQDPIAEIGDNLDRGNICATLVQLDPMTFSTQIGEQNIFDVKLGQKANVKLLSGQTFEGEVSFIAASSDAKTRTFNVEIEVPNPNGEILDGLSASGSIALEKEQAFLLNPNWLVLHDDGRVGVRIVDKNNVVDFRQVEILAQNRQGIWVNGLENKTQVITLGQDYVVAGESVRTSSTAELETGANNSENATKDDDAKSEGAAQ